MQVLANSLEARVFASDNSTLARECRSDMRAANGRLLKLTRKVNMSLILPIIRNKSNWGLLCTLLLPLPKCKSIMPHFTSCARSQGGLSCFVQALYQRVD